MKQSPLRDRFLAAGAQFVERYGTESVAGVDERRIEYSRIRESVGLTDFSHLQVFRIPQETAIDFLDPLLAGTIAKARYGRVAHTFLADPDGNLISDCYVANNDEEYLLICESIVDDAALRAVLDDHGAQAAQVDSLSEGHTVLSIDGFKAWKVARELFGADVLGLPYLSIEVYPFEDTKLRLLRAGKTSEFGFLVVIPDQYATSFFDRCRALVEQTGGGLCGVSIHDDMRLEGRFFNIFAEGARVRDPLTLGLQWMIDFDKSSFIGSGAILARRSSGTSRKIIGVQTAAGVEGLPVGATILHEGAPVAEVVASMYSYILEAYLGLALFPVELAFAGLEFRAGAPVNCPITTVSMPPILPRSLTVKLDEM